MLNVEDPPWRPIVAQIVNEGLHALWLCALGGMAYVLSTVPRLKRPSRHGELRSLIGEHLISEPPVARLARGLLGTVLLVACVPFAAFSSGMWQNLFSGRYAKDSLTLLLVAMTTTAVAMLLLNFGSRFLARRGERVLWRDRRRPFLYLRSFQQDARIVDRGLLNWLTLFFGRYQTSERSLGLAVADLGPLLAIGKPGERLPPLGASRVYVGDQWQQVVSQLVEQSQLVILRIGQTKGFWWEIKHLLENCDPRKVVIYLPKKDRVRQYARFRERAAEVFPQPLPVGIGDALFLGFGTKWEPLVIAPPRGSLLRLFRRMLIGAAPRVRDGLNFALWRRGLKVRRLRLLGREWVILLMLGIWFAYSVFVFVASRVQKPAAPFIYELY